MLWPRLLGWYQTALAGWGTAVHVTDTNLFGSQRRKWEGKSDGPGPADLHMISGSVHTHTHTQILEKLGPCPNFEQAFSVVSFCRLSILQASGWGDEEQRNSLHLTHQTDWGGQSDRWGDRKIISGACASPKQSWTMLGCHFLTERSVKASVCFEQSAFGLF